MLALSPAHISYPVALWYLYKRKLDAAKASSACLGTDQSVNPAPLIHGSSFAVGTDLGVHDSTLLGQPWLFPTMQLPKLKHQTGQTF